jgi:RHS repeat-associated protein
MFQFRSEQLASIRRKKIGDALIATFADGPVRACWNLTNDCVVATDPLDHSTRFGFDAQGFIGVVASPMGRLWQIECLPDGKTAAFKNPAGHTLGFTYAPSGQLDRIFSNGRPRIQLLYNNRRMYAGASFPDGTFSAIQFTPWNGPGIATQRIGAQEIYEYDRHRRLTALIDGKGARTEFRYGRWSGPDATIDPNGGVESYFYSDKGALCQIATETTSVELEADDKGRPLVMKFNDGAEVSCSYDDAGRLTAASIGDYACQAARNDKGQLVMEQNGEAVTEYEYDAAGRLISMTYPTGEKIEYEWDADSRLTLVRDWDGGEHALEYAEYDRGFNLRAPNGLSTLVTLNILGSPESIAVSSDSNSLLSLRYTYDQEDRIAIQRDSAFGDRSFRYDAESQLHSATFQNHALNESYQYDGAGNPVELSGKSARFDAANQMLSYGHARLAYDDRGNVIAMETVNGILRCTYNGRKLIARSESPAGDVTTYDYDGFGRRIRKTKGETVIEYLWAGNQLIGEVSTRGETVVRRDYLYFPGTFTPLAMRVGGKVYSYHTDHLGSPRLLSAPDGSIVWAADYSSFGQARISHAKVDNPLRAPGQYFDEETGLYYNRFRYYSPGMGRYMSRDPLGLLAGSNLYRYAANNPINRVDPLGLLNTGGTLSSVLQQASPDVTSFVKEAPSVLAGDDSFTTGVAASALAGGLNQAMNAQSFCLPCALKAAGLGGLSDAADALSSGLPDITSATDIGSAALLSGLGAAQKYISAVLNGQKFSWSGLGSAVLGQAVTGGISQAVTGVDADPATDDDDLSNVGQSLGDALGGDSDLPSDDAMGDVGTSVGQALGDDVPLPTAEEIEEYLNTPAPDDVPVTEPDPNGWR